MVTAAPLATKLARVRCKVQAPAESNAATSERSKHMLAGGVVRTLASFADTAPKPRVVHAPVRCSTNAPAPSPTVNPASDDPCSSVSTTAEVNALSLFYFGNTCQQSKADGSAMELFGHGLSSGLYSAAGRPAGGACGAAKVWAKRLPQPGATWCMPRCRRQSAKVA